jgi:hypothetical protein
VTSHIFTPYTERLAQGTADWDAQDIRFILCMTNTTADTDRDAGSLSAIGTMDEYDGAGYARAALAAELTTRDDPNNRTELGGTSPVSFGAAVAPGTRQAAGHVIYRFVDGNPANDLPIAWVDTGGYPLAGGGGAFQITQNAEGHIQITTPA